MISKSHQENFGDYIWLTMASVVCGERLHPVPGSRYFDRQLRTNGYR